MSYIKGTILLFLFLIYSLSSESQNYSIKFHGDSSFKNESPKSYSDFHFDSIRATNELYKYLNRMKLDGYLGASIDSVVFDSSVVNVYLYTGNQYNINKLTIYDETGLHILYQYIQPHLFKAKKHPNFITDIYEEFITKYENRGYPFSSIIPDTVNIESNSISISSRIWKGDQYVFNRVIIKGTTGISDKYIGQYLSIKMNDPYNEEKVKQIQDKINGLNFMTLIKKPDIEFREGKVDVYIYMKEKKSNLFSGILGLIPKSVDNESFHLTGDIKILLLNNINQGEQLALNWIGGIQNNQKLDLRLKIPYLFNSPIGVETFFFLEKKDTSYVTTFFKPGLSYQIGIKDYLTGYFLDNKSFLLKKSSIDTAFFKDTKSLFYGISYQANHTDYLNNPRSGYVFTIDFAYGNRKLNDTHFAISRAKFDFSYYIPLYRKFSIKLSTRNNYIFSDSVLYRNELIRVGGLEEIRGFDEDFFWVDGYSAVSFEMKYFFEKESNIFGFIDMAQMRLKTINEIQQDYPIGIGIGVNLSTKAGILSLSYAMGKTEGESFNFSNSKIHIGYTNRF